MSVPAPSPVLVTGGAGFIGSHVCDALAARGVPVRCMDNLATGKRENVAHLEGTPGFEWLGGDVRSLDDCRHAVEGVEVVLHLAALGSVPRSIAEPLAANEVNLTGFLHILEACRSGGARRLVYASSSSVYGDSTESPKREAVVGNPLSPYAVTKAGDEAYARMYTRLHGLGTIGLRFFNVFGERQDPEGAYAAAIPRFIRAFLRHERPQVFGDGLQSRDFTYVANAVGALMAAMDSTDPRAMGEVFNVACGERTTLLQLIDVLRAELARMDPAIAGLGVDHVADRPGDVRGSVADISRSREVLGYVPAIGLHQGLERAVPWYARNWGGDP